MAQIITEYNNNKPVQAVNMKNQYTCLHPSEALEFTESTVDIPLKVARKSVEKRPNELWYRRADEVNAAIADDVRAEDAEDEGSASLHLVSDHSPAEEPVPDEVSDQAPDEEPLPVQGQAVEPLTVQGPAVEPLPVQVPSVPRTGLSGSSCLNVERMLARRIRFRPELKIPNRSPISCTGKKFV
jgi:hypothetical protein